MSPVGKSLGKNLPSESFREVGESVCCLQANASHAMARHWPGCGQSGTPPAPFTAGRCYCPPQAEVFVEIGARARHTPMPAGDCSCRLVFFSFLLLHVFFAVMSSAWRGEPPHPLSPSYSPRGVPPPGPPAVGDSVLGLLILQYCMYSTSVDQVVIVSCTVNK